MMKKKQRLDIFLFQAGLSSSRESAKREIIAGWVKVNGETVRVPSRSVIGDEEISVSRPGGGFVSRGGAKLEKGLEYFSINMEGKTAVDLGASTGGFTDCMLKRGASQVYAVDVGYGQLDYRLRNDRRVVVMERKNARNLEKNEFPREVDFVTADLSFISIVKVFPVIRDLFPLAEGILLIKPQFESLKGEHKKGVVRDKGTHAGILKRVIKALAELGLVYRGLTYSPVKGPAGNIEFLLYFSNCGQAAEDAPVESEIDTVVESAHLHLHP